jgi:hypothetical protein
MLQAVLLVLGQLSVSATPDSRLDVSCPEYVQRAMIVEPARFSVGTARMIGQEFLRQHPQVTFGKLIIATSKEYLAYYSGKGTSGSDFENWQHRMTLNKRDGWEPIQDIAEVQVIAGSAILRLQRGGAVSRVLLSGRDPLKIIQDGSYEILDFAGVASPDAEGKGRCLDHLSVFLEAKSKISESVLNQIAASFQKLVPATDLFLSVRNDAWFVSHSDFPPIYAFSEDGNSPFPNKKQYMEGKEMMRYFPGVR